MPLTPNQKHRIRILHEAVPGWLSEDLEKTAVAQVSGDQDLGQMLQDFWETT